MKIFANDIPLKNTIIRNNVCKITSSGDWGMALQDMGSGLVANNIFDARGAVNGGATFDVQPT